MKLSSLLIVTFERSQCIQYSLILSFHSSIILFILIYSTFQSFTSTQHSNHSHLLNIPFILLYSTFHSFLFTQHSIHSHLLNIPIIHIYSTFHSFTSTQHSNHSHFTNMNLRTPLCLQLLTRQAKALRLTHECRLRIYEDADTSAQTLEQKCLALEALLERYKTENKGYVYT